MLDIQKCPIELVYISWYYPNFKYEETEFGERLSDLSTVTSCYLENLQLRPLTSSRAFSICKRRAGASVSEVKRPEFLAGLYVPQVAHGASRQRPDSVSSRAPYLLCSAGLEDAAGFSRTCRVPLTEGVLEVQLGPCVGSTLGWPQPHHDRSQKSLC